MLTQERLKQILHYDPETGVFTRILAISRKSKVGDIVGTPNAHGHLVINIAGKIRYAHRLAWLYMTGSFPINSIDHINGVKTDNRFCNLRDVTHTVNCQNHRAPQSSNSHGYMGCTRDKKRWTSSICVNGNRIRLGMFDTPEEAEAAYLNAKRIHHEGCTI